eukprot:jgi/Chrzof1/5836/Cz16g17190.t1
MSLFAAPAVPWFVELGEELAGAPEEQQTAVAGFDSAAAVAARQRLEARAAVEEDLMVRVPLSKQEAKKLRAQRRAGLSGQGLLDDFADEVADLVQLSQGQDKGGKPAAAGGSGLADLFGRQRLSQKFGADLTSDRKKFRSGDEDVPTRNPIHERRSQFDATAARRAAAAGVGGEDDNDDMDFDYGAAGKSARKRGAVAMGEEDEFYAASKAARQASNAARQDKHKVPELLPPLPDATASGQRKITKEIEKNRGLTPHRNKDLKNPRKKHRVKFAQATVRRKGQVQGVRPSQGAGYGGEETGIKARVAKSVRLG